MLDIEEFALAMHLIKVGHAVSSVRGIISPPLIGCLSLFSQFEANYTIISDIWFDLSRWDNMPQRWENRILDFLFLRKC